MKIAFCTHQWPGARPGGIGVYAKAAAAGLAAAGHEVHVFTLPRRPGRQVARVATTIDGVIVHEVPSPADLAASGLGPQEVLEWAASGEALYRLATARLLADALQAVHTESPFDIAEFADYEAHGLGLCLTRPVDLPLVVHWHGCSAITRTYNGRDNRRTDDVAEAFEFLSMAAADGCCAPSQAVIAETQRLGGPSREVIVLPHPVPTPCGPTAELPVDGPVLFLGRLESIKGADRLGRALPEFLRTCPSARVRLVGADTATAPGGGSMRAWIEQRLPASLRERVEFAGPAPHQAVAAELNASRFCVLPSRFESFGLAAAEALAAGRAIVVPQGTALEALGGEAAVAFEPESATGLAAAMSRLFNDPPRASRLGRAAAQRAAALSGPAAIQSRLAFYQTVIARGRREPAVHPRLAARMLPPRVRRFAESLVTRDAGWLGLMRAERTSSVGERLRRRLDALGSGIEFVLYGAGWHTEKLLAQQPRWAAAGHRLIGLIDDRPELAGQRLWGLPVASPLALAKWAGGPAIVLSSDSAEEQLWCNSRSLRDAGMKVARLYGAGDDERPEAQFCDSGSGHSSSNSRSA